MSNDLNEAVEIDEGKYKGVKNSVMKARLIEIADSIERNTIDIDDLVDITIESKEISKIMKVRLDKIKAMLED